MYSLDHAGALQLIQITDTHLVEAENGHLLGLETLHSLECVLNSVKTEQGPFELFLVTGDISQDGSETSYQRLHDALEPFSTPSFWLSGNHDSFDSMRAVARNTEHLHSVVRSTHWQIILLNSQVKGYVHGMLEDDQLELVENTLAERPDLHTLISVHHHPVNIGSEWMDTIGLKNGDQLMEIVNRYDNAKCVLWGHVHQQSDTVLGHVRMLSTPSTCVQFEPESDEFSVEKIPPGYRWMQLNPDGSIDTRVSRVEGIDFEIDWSVKGY